MVGKFAKLENHSVTNAFFLTCVQRLGLNHSMFVAFFESVKYVGHLLPVSFLRVFMGYYYLQQALLKYNGDFLQRPRIADQIGEWMPVSQAPAWYKIFVNTYFIP